MALMFRDVDHEGDNCTWRLLGTRGALLWQTEISLDFDSEFVGWVGKGQAKLRERVSKTRWAVP